MLTVLSSPCGPPITTAPSSLVHQYLRLGWRVARAQPGPDLAHHDRWRHLDQAVRLAWIDLPLEYPAFSFERYALTAAGLEALVLGPHTPGAFPPLRGVVAHFKGMVTRTLACSRPLWRPGSEIVPLTDHAAVARTRGRLNRLARG